MQNTVYFRCTILFTEGKPRHAPEAKEVVQHTVFAEGWWVLAPNTHHVRQLTTTCATRSPRDLMPTSVLCSCTQTNRVKDKDMNLRV